MDRKAECILSTVFIVVAVLALALVPTSRQVSFGQTVTYVRRARWVYALPAVLLAAGGMFALVRCHLSTTTRARVLLVAWAVGNLLGSALVMWGVIVGLRLANLASEGSTEGVLALHDLAAALAWRVWVGASLLAVLLCLSWYLWVGRVGGGQGERS